MFRFLVVTCVALGAILLAACSDNEATIGPTDEPTGDPTATNAPETSGPTDPPTATPTPPPEPTPEAVDEEEAALRAEAAKYCPAQALEGCTNLYITVHGLGQPSALCVTEEQQYWFETPQGSVGDPCREPSAVIVTIVREQ